jgi:hypothetical protein
VLTKADQLDAILGSIRIADLLLVCGDYYALQAACYSGLAFRCNEMKGNDARHQKSAKAVVTAPYAA